MPEVSHNQLITVLTKSCLGAGVVRGVAEDVAGALAQLDGNELKTCITELCDALSRFDHKSAVLVTPERHGNTSIISKASLLHHGPSLVELATILSDDGKTLLIEQMDCPNCLQALAKAASINGKIKETPSGAVFTFQNAEDKTAALPKPARAHVDRALWAKLLHYAHATMVPSDAASQADAGAGDGYND
ncbi:MAG: DUF3726 domain-containing protein [Pseudomonadota bacterium]